MSRKGVVSFYDPLTKLGVLKNEEGSILNFRYYGDFNLPKGSKVEFECTWDTGFADQVKKSSEV